MSAARADGDPGAGPSYWLVKSEPEAFSWDDLWRARARTSRWDGVRNYQARNFMRDGMKRGDLVFFYHSSTNPPAIVGVAEVVREAYPDPTALDPADAQFDAKSNPDSPRWVAVDLRARRALSRPVTLAELKAAKGLQAMALLRASRLSVTPVTPAEWAIIMELGSG